MTKRKIVKIDEEKCNGCGLCIPNCAEGALKIIDGKAKLISDEFCDGLGACLGNCPQDAIKVIEREAAAFDEEAVKKHLTPQDDKGSQVLIQENIPCGCPGSAVQDRRDEKSSQTTVEAGKLQTELRQWPIQLHLVPPTAPYLKNADLLIAADCVPFAYADFHRDFLKDKVLIIGCPKLDDAEFYVEKLANILKSNDIKSVTIVNMEVPCCFGLQRITEDAIKKSGKIITLRQTIITTRGEKQ
jgi:NAD-dependent dihydropyrimidine dehydrogenase PreA subunit